MIFLCRHYLELLLKRTLIQSQAVLDREVRLPTHHYIDRIWEDLRPLIEEIFAEDDLADLGELERVIRELAALDRKSMTFRYPVDKEDQPALPAELRHVDLRQFWETFERATYLLYSTCEGVTVYLDYKREAGE